MRENRYLANLGDDALEFLSGHTRLLSYEADELIIREGQPSEGLFIIQSSQFFRREVPIHLGL